MFEDWHAIHTLLVRYAGFVDSGRFARLCRPVRARHLPARASRHRCGHDVPGRGARARSSGADPAVRGWHPAHQARHHQRGHSARRRPGHLRVLRDGVPADGRASAAAHRLRPLSRPVRAGRRVVALRRPRSSPASSSETAASTSTGPAVSPGVATLEATAGFVMRAQPMHADMNWYGVLAHHAGRQPGQAAVCLRRRRRHLRGDGEPVGRAWRPDFTSTGSVPAMSWDCSRTTARSSWRRSSRPTTSAPS